ncbi:C40 family peptidase [Budvicia aquatica]|uniref:NlpC/P60 family n=1 Tax=Budvicia aquatica TaxID=82979 RepID=A0A2C6DLP7_9GAMM|nr:C40 family peptidase [Budvicia aquatica]PHI29684.1 phage tail protein [Budvicia aquatica]VFS48065.1 NlpC/P60 family [Budvicia aquatica]
MIEEKILAHALECAPQESCGFVIKTNFGQRYIPCRNIALDPTEYFEISPDDWIKAHAEGELIALVHSHPDGIPVLSQTDRTMQQRTNLPWWLVCNNKIYKFNNIAPLIGRAFKHGVMDCYTLFRDAYHLAGINLPDFYREDEWWKKEQSLYLDNMEKTQFYRVNDIQPGDIILVCLGSEKANHSAIYCGDQYVLHHCPQRLSKRDVYSGYWLNYTDSIWRHKQWQPYGFTAICNDMAASSNLMY